MARRAASARKALSAANLAALGADRLAAILMDAAGPALKRRLRLELAAEVGAADLALGLDQRLDSLAESRTRISWRKRPELLSELLTLKTIILHRLAPLDAKLALDRFVSWFDLASALATRVQDPKGELAFLFDAAAPELAELASRNGPDIAAPVLGDALETRFSTWASWIGRGAEGFSPELAGRLLRDLIAGRPRPTGRRALVARKLADRAGDLNAWILALPDEDRTRPEVGAELARRLAVAGRATGARAALEAARPRDVSVGRRGKGRESTEAPPEAWSAAEIAVLEAEGRTIEAGTLRWDLFARTLSTAVLRDILATLEDFEDVVALDRAFEIAATHVDPMKGLAFLMNWPALREAAGLVLERRDRIRGGFDDVPLWASRLAGRYPSAALVLLRARALALLRLGSGLSEEVTGLIGEAEALASGADDPRLPTHAEFLEEVRRLARPWGMSWR